MTKRKLYYFGSIAAIAGLVGLQFLASRILSDLGQQYHEMAPLVIPYTVLAVLSLAALQFALIFSSRLVTLENNTQLNGRAGLRAINTVFALILASVIFAFLVFFHAGSIAAIGGPLIGVALALILAVGLAAFIVRNKIRTSLLADD